MVPGLEALKPAAKGHHFTCDDHPAIDFFESLKVQTIESLLKDLDFKFQNQNQLLLNGFDFHE